MIELKEKLSYNEGDWIYASARVRALEKRLPDGQRLERMLQARDVAEVCALCAEDGLKIAPEDPEAGLREYVADVYAQAAELSPDPRFLDVIRIQNDAHNVKSCVKSSVSGRDPSHLLVDTGTMPPVAVARAVEERDFDALPGGFRAAAAEAVEVWSRSRDPQMIDVIIDDACALARKDFAARSGVDFFVKMVDCDCDVANILTCLRIMRMSGEGADIEYLQRMLLPCGGIGADFFLSVYNDGESALWAAVASTRYAAVAQALDAVGEYSLSAVERAFENYKIDFLGTTRFILAGAPVIVAYVCASEYFVKNARIIIAGKNAGLDTEKIRERLRDAYV